jgi:hypothetical protein
VQVPDQDRGGSNFNFAKGATLLIGAAGVFVAYNYFANKAEATNQSGQTQNDIFTQQATTIKNLLDGWTSNDDIEKIIIVAAQITDFVKVTMAYNKLTNGDNLEDKISSEMSPEQYQRFITALNKRGASSNSADVVTRAAPIPQGLKVGDKILINNDTQNVNLYRNSNDYGTGKIYFAVAKNVPQQPVTFLGAEIKEYTSARPPIKVLVYKVRLVTGTIVYIRAADIRKKAAVSGLNSGMFDLHKMLF